MQQPSLGKWLPVSLMVGLLAALSVYLTGTLSSSMAWFGAPWVLFISWGAWFSVGAKMRRLGKFIIALTGGVAFGWLTVFAYTGILQPLVGDPWALPVTVFFVATTIVLLELTDWFELAFVYFFAYAGYFAYLFGGFAKADGILWPAIYCWILLMVGVAFALLNSSLKNLILGAEGVPPEQRTTVYDKE